jgi:hypothetical protein
VQLCHSYGADVAAHTSRRLCGYCSAIQLPAVTSSAKIRRRSRRSQANLQREKKREKKVKNEVVSSAV